MIKQRNREKFMQGLRRSATIKETVSRHSLETALYCNFFFPPIRVLAPLVLFTKAVFVSMEWWRSVLMATY